MIKERYLEVEILFTSINTDNMEIDGNFWTMGTIDLEQVCHFWDYDRDKKGTTLCLTKSGLSFVVGLAYDEFKKVFHNYKSQTILSGRN